VIISPLKRDVAIIGNINAIKIGVLGVEAA